MNKVVIQILTIFMVVLSFFNANAQAKKIDYLSPKDYIIAGIVVDGVRNLDHNQIISKSGLIRGNDISIPGDDITQAIRKLWKEKLFSDIQIIVEKIQGENVFLMIKLKERSRLSRYSFKGISKSHADNLREDLDLYQG